MPKNVTHDPVIEKASDRLTITVRARRSGDSAHYVLGALGTVFGLLILLIALGNGTLFDSWATLPLVIGGLVYGWFALTRLINRRVVTIDCEMLTVTEGPLPTFSSQVEVPMADMGKVTTRDERRWVPPLQWYGVSHVEAEGLRSPLFKALEPDDASRVRAAIVSFVSVG